MLNRLNNILLIFILFVSIIFTQQIMDTNAQNWQESEKIVESSKLPYHHLFFLIKKLYHF